MGLLMLIYLFVCVCAVCGCTHTRVPVGSEDNWRTPFSLHPQSGSEQLYLLSRLSAPHCDSCYYSNYRTEPRGTYGIPALGKWKQIGAPGYPQLHMSSRPA